MSRIRAGTPGGRAPLAWGLLALAAACAPDAREPVGEAAVSAGDVSYGQEELAALAPDGRQRLATLSAFGLLAAEERLDTLASLLAVPDLQRRTLERFADELALRLSGLSSGQLERRYRRDPEHELVVRHLVILSERWREDAQREEARRRARRALARVRAGQSFAAVAAEVSEEPGAAERGGLLEPGRRGDWVEEFWRAASRLPEGGVSGVVETRYGFHVLKLEERRVVPFEQVRAEVAPRVVAGTAGPAAARAWMDSVRAEVRMDPTGFQHWRADPRRAHEARVAEWPDGALTGSELELLLLPLDPEERRRVEEGDAGELASWLETAAGRQRLLEAAAAAGVEPSAEERTEMVQEWRGRLLAWAVSLGFAAGQEPEEVRSSALAALVSDRQGTALARSEVLRRTAAIRRIQPVEVRATPPADPAR